MAENTKVASVLICSDIFGVTPQLIRWAESLDVKADLIYLDPYESSSEFVHESAAYAEFLKVGGVEEYCKKIRSALNTYSPSVIIGFSAGGACAYQSLCTTNHTKLPKKLIGFYPGQIRHFTHLRPKTTCIFYFAQSEDHFDVDTVIQQLAKHDEVFCQKTSYKHGFMNQLSIGFSQQGLQNHTQNIKYELQSLLV